MADKKPSAQPNPKTLPYAVLLGVGTILAVALVFSLIAWPLGFGRYMRGLVLFIRTLWPLVLTFAVAMAVALIATRRPKVGFGIVGVLLAGTAVSGLLPSSPPIGNVLSELNAAGFGRAEAYTGATAVDRGERPGYDQRTALRIGQLTIRRSLSGVVGDITDPLRVNNEWCSVIVKKGTFWNSWSDSVVCIDDAGDVRRASFPPDTVPAPGGGWRRSNLGNVLTSAAGILDEYSFDDVYGAIVEVDGEAHARMFVPLRRHQGVDFSVPSMPSGVAVFGVGDDGAYQVTVDRDVKPGEHPGPVAGLRSAELLREKINALNGFLPYKREARSPESLQPTFALGDDTVDEEADPNAANATEFVLYRDGVPYAITPLTSFGGASTITAYLEVRLDTVVQGQPLASTLYRLPTSRAANASIVNSIRVLYGQDLADDDEIYEVTPTSPGKSLVTIARGDQVRFTAVTANEVSSGRPVGEICVFNRTGREVDCADLDGDARPLGTLISRPTGSGAAGDDFDGNLSDVPTAALLAELERRIESSSG